MIRTVFEFWDTTRLLRDTERSIADIATSCGFCEHSAFTRAFHAETGTTPKEFHYREF